MLSILKNQPSLVILLYLLLTYLRAANKLIPSMDSLQSVTSLAFNSYWFWRLFLHYIFTRKGQRKIAFTVPTYNNSQPTKRYQWNLLPQGMSNSSILCQYFVTQPFKWYVSTFLKWEFTIKRMTFCNMIEM